MLLRVFQKFGHKPILLLGGGTTLVGDPSGKDETRKILSETDIKNNKNKLKEVFKKFVSFESSNNAILIDNYDWLTNLKYIDFLREIGSKFSVNKMMSLESIKQRLNREQNLSFLEFNYSLLQAYDFLELKRKNNCKIQFGGSDQWGNILTGNELIRRIDGGESFALTTPLITKSDGGKFGKTEEGNVWLDETKTSPYKFYQFWINVSDEDAKIFIKIFTQKNKEEIDILISDHNKEPHLSILQNA